MIEQKFGLQPELIKGRNGVFEVRLDTELIFSKRSLGRFPHPGEVEEAISARLPD